MRMAIILCLWMPFNLLAANPASTDRRLTVELVAEHPMIVTPTGLAVDQRGRVFVAESHTHFRPEGYDGPPADRILILPDENGDGRAEGKKIYHEGFTHVMDIEFHHDGSLYVATRRDIHRMRDTDGDDQADEVTLIVKLDTRGDYPHNGLSGIAFDLQGGFHFGLGENLGEPYTLTGTDGTSIRGGGEGGSTYWVGDKGERLRRVSTGWWNPYGMCTDSYGRVFGTDNDPDASPPCRLIQVVEGGDFGYEFRYGRSGRNPLITWDGELPGTLPMIAGTGEAPCHIVAYESDALPEEYFGSLLVPVWADHRVERYVLTQSRDRGLVTTRRQTLVEGPDDFRPVGIDVAPDGTVFLSDWVSSSYTLHKQGRVWRIRPVGKPAASRPTDRFARAQSLDRRVREAAIREIAARPDGTRQLLELAATGAIPASRAAAVQRLAALTRPAPAEHVQALLRVAGDSETAPVELRVLAARVAFEHASALPRTRNETVHKLAAGKLDAVRAAAIPYASRAGECLEAFESPDPYFRHLAVERLATILAESDTADLPGMDSKELLPMLLAWKRSRAVKPEAAEQGLEASFTSNDPAVRIAAVKWIADDRLTRFRPQLESWLAAPDLDLSTFLAISVALDRLDGTKPTDRPPPERLLEKILDPRAPSILRRHALRLIDPAFPRLREEQLTQLLGDPDPGIRLEAVQTLAGHPGDRRFQTLRRTAQDETQPAAVRAAAISGLAAKNDEFADLLIGLASSAKEPLVRDEALRSLVGASLTDSQRGMLVDLAQKQPDASEAIARLVDDAVSARPPATDIDAWITRVSGNGDPVRGERIFFGTRVGNCAKCHQAEGRGESVGPDLSRIGQRLKLEGKNATTWLLKTILQPGRDMAPQYTPWVIVTTDGKQHIGLPRRKGGNAEAYLGIDGKEFVLKKEMIESHHESTVSIMPADLLLQLTRQELADLFAYLVAASG